MRNTFLCTIALSLVCTSVVEAQFPGGRPRNFPVSPSLFRQMEAARARAQAQTARVPLDQLTLLNAQLRMRLASEGNLNAVNNLQAGDRARLILERQQQVNGEVLRGNQPVLPRQQLDRFNQVQFQMTSFATLQRADLARNLQLSDAQLKALKDAQAQYNAHLAEIHQRATVNLREAQDMFLELQQAVEVGLPRFLTPAQMQAWRQLVGNQFTFSLDPSTGTLLVR